MYITRNQHVVNSVSSYGRVVVLYHIQLYRNFI
uniref:Uncharacterized protein n=1 Tax=Arundo donax TaxID=35708 RepID=A0A0A9HVM6_ARUDO